MHGARRCARSSSSRPSVNLKDPDNHKFHDNNDNHNHDHNGPQYNHNHAGKCVD